MNSLILLLIAMLSISLSAGHPQRSTSEMECSDVRELPSIKELADHIDEIIAKNMTVLDALKETLEKENKTAEFEKIVTYGANGTIHIDLPALMKLEGHSLILAHFFIARVFPKLEKKEECLIKMLHMLHYLREDAKFRTAISEHIKKNFDDAKEYLIESANATEVNWEKLLANKEKFLAKFIENYLHELKWEENRKCPDNLKMPDAKEMETRMEEIILKNVTVLKEFTDILNKFNLTSRIIVENNQVLSINFTVLKEERDLFPLLRSFFARNVIPKLSVSELCMIKTMSRLFELLKWHDEKVIRSLDEYIQSHVADYEQYLNSSDETNNKHELKFNIQKLMKERPDVLFQFLKNKDLF